MPTKPKTNREALASVLVLLQDLPDDQAKEVLWLALEAVDPRKKEKK